jgi:hypothetical protein
MMKDSTEAKAWRARSESLQVLKILMKAVRIILGRVDDSVGCRVEIDQRLKELAARRIGWWY